MVLLCYSQTLAGVMLDMHYLDSVHITNVYVLPNYGRLEGLDCLVRYKQAMIGILSKSSSSLSTMSL